MLGKLYQHTDTLSKNEMDYWFSIQHPKMKEQYLASKILTRLLLSKYCNGEIHPHEWVFEAGKYGKPQLSKAFDTLKVFFNLSHCDTVFTICIDSHTIGIDIESYQFNIDDDVAKTVFSATELAGVIGMNTIQKNDYYIQLWTLKESFSKQQGLGIQMPFHKFSVHKINKAFFKVCSSIQVKNELLIKNLKLSIEDENYSMSVSARSEQFSEVVLKYIDSKDRCVQTKYPALSAQIS